MNSYEFFRNLRDYENKYGKLGESKSILHEDDEPVQIKRKPNEIKHSYESDYFEFRKKVQAGRERYSKVHTRTISPDELNARYHEDLINNGVLIHSNAFNKNGKKWGDGYYDKIDNYYSDGSARYFQTKDEYDAYLEEKTKKQNAAKEANKQVQGASSDNARGAGNDYQKWLDQQKAGVKATGAKLENNNFKNTQKLTSDNNTSSANKATSNASSANKATTNYATTSQVQSQQVKDNYNKNVNQSLSSNTSSGDNAKGQGTEYQEYLKKKKEEEEREKARKQTEMYNKNAEAAKNAASDRGFKESDNEEIERTVRNKRDEYKKIMGSNDKSAKAFEEDFMKQKGIKTEDDAKKYGLIKLVKELNDAYDDEIEKINKRNAEEAEKRAEISRKNDQGRDAAIKNSNKGSNYGSSIEEQKRKEELARKNSQGRDAAISNSNKKNEGEQIAEAVKSTLEGTRMNSLGKTNDSNRNNAIKNSGPNSVERTEGEDMADAARKTLKGTHERSLGKTNDSLKNADIKRADDAAALRKREAEREETESNSANAQPTIKSTKGYDKELSPIDLDIERNEAAFTDKDNMGEKKRREEIARKNDQGRNSAISNSNKKTEGEQMSDTARSTLEKTHDASRAKTNDSERNQAISNSGPSTAVSKGGSGSSTNKLGGQTVTERNQKIINEGMNKNADPKALASKYGVSEEYIKELLYNSTGKIFHSAFDNSGDFFANLEAYKRNHGIRS